MKFLVQTLFNQRGEQSNIYFNIFWVYFVELSAVFACFRFWGKSWGFLLDSSLLVVSHRHVNQWDHLGIILFPAVVSSN